MSKGPAELADSIALHLFENGPTQLKQLFDRTHGDSQALTYACSKYAINIVPLKGSGIFASRHNYKAEDFIGGLANHSQRIAFVDGDELPTLEIMKFYLPKPSSYRENKGFRKAFSRYIPYRFPPRLVALLYHYYDYKVGNVEKMPLRSVLQDPLVIERSAQLLARKSGIDADVVITSREDGVNLTQAIAKRLGVGIAICDKTVDENGSRTISLNKKIATKLKDKNVLIADDWIDSRWTMREMKKIVEDSDGQNEGTIVQIVNQEYQSLPNLSYLCSMPSMTSFS